MNTTPSTTTTWQVRAGEGLDALRSDHALVEYADYSEALAHAGRLARDHNRPFTVIRCEVKTTFTTSTTARP